MANRASRGKRGCPFPRVPGRPEVHRGGALDRQRRREFREIVSASGRSRSSRSDKSAQLLGSRAAVSADSRATARTRILQIQADQLYPLRRMLREMNLGGCPRPVREGHDTKVRNCDSTGVRGDFDFPALGGFLPPGSSRDSYRLDFRLVAPEVLFPASIIEMEGFRQLEFFAQPVGPAADPQILDHRRERQNAGAFRPGGIAVPFLAVDGHDARLELARGHFTLHAVVLHSRSYDRGVHAPALFLARDMDPTVSERDLRIRSAARLLLMLERRAAVKGQGVFRAEVGPPVGETKVG